MKKDSLIAPHGGELVNRQAQMENFSPQPSAKTLTISNIEFSDLYMIAIGALSPLKGFMGSSDYYSVLYKMRLDSGLPWAIPITLSASASDAEGLREGDIAYLTHGSNGQNACVGEISVKEVYKRDKRREALAIYKTDDEKHPGVAMLNRHGEYLIGGDVLLYKEPPFAVDRSYYLTPRDCRKRFLELGWRRIVGFQTRNPIHRAHEYIIKSALEITDGLLLHPIAGETKSDDVPVDVRFLCYETLIRHYFPQNRVMLVVNPSAMRYAGPREAIHHAIIRKNYGCTHFIVGRDHAGVGNYYGPYDAQKIFDEFTPEELAITPLFFENSFFCKRCGGMASNKTCGHDPSEHVSLSGTKVREMLSNGETPPAEFTREEIAKILIKHYWKYSI